jgi:hypothetical protein
MAAPAIALQPAAVTSSQDGTDRQPATAERTFAIAVIALTVLGAVLRVIVAGQSLIGDELSTYWISVDHSLGGVLSLLYSTGPIKHAEITPPLSFVASWLATRLGHSPELLRLPALLAGTATIPLVYALGRRAIGARAALLAAAVTALSPFMIYYSAEARAYGLMMFFVVGAILSMLLAIDTGHKRYWWLYAICSAGAFYSHYTSVFVLGVAWVWLLWTQPARRRATLLAAAGAVLLVVPWIPGLIADLHSPTVPILSSLSPFTPHAIWVDVEHWAIGYPYPQPATPLLSSTGLAQLPGRPALALLGLAAILACVGVAHRLWRAGSLPAWREFLRASARGRVALLVALMLATPVGEILVSASGNHIMLTRDLAASWPFLALCAAAFVIAAGPRLGIAAGALGLIALCLAAGKLFEPALERQNYQAAANYVAAHAQAGDVVIDETWPTPGPLTGFDVAFHRDLTVVRAGEPAERNHPFTATDPDVPILIALNQAIHDARGGRVFVVAAELPTFAFPDGYRLVTARRYPGLAVTVVGVYARSSTPAP